MTWTVFAKYLTKKWWLLDRVKCCLVNSELAVSHNPEGCLPSVGACLKPNALPKVTHFFSGVFFMVKGYSKAIFGIQLNSTLFPLGTTTVPDCLPPPHF